MKIAQCFCTLKKSTHTNKSNIQSLARFELYLSKQCLYLCWSIFVFSILAWNWFIWVRTVFANIFYLYFDIITEWNWHTSPNDASNLASNGFRKTNSIPNMYDQFRKTPSSQLIAVCFNKLVSMDFIIYFQFEIRTNWQTDTQQNKLMLMLSEL